MRFLRLGSTRSVTGVLVGVLALIVVLAVVASAAIGGGGQAPPAKPLAQAIHDSLPQSPLSGVSARVRFTSHLFDGATTDQSSALVKGGSGRLWAAAGKLRLELQSDNGDAQVAYADGKGFVYDGPTNTAYTFSVPSGHRRGSTDNGALSSVAAIQKRIAEAERRVAIGNAQPTVIAGAPAYRVRVMPRQAGGLIGAAELAWDATHGVPLDVAIYARGQSSPAVELKVTDIAFGSVDPSVFTLAPPAGAKVVDLGGSGGAAAGNTEPSGKPGFAAVDPMTLGPRARRHVKQTGDGYLVLYGKGLDTIAVFEHKAAAGDKPRKIGTPLGGLVSFQRGGIAYTVAGSQPLSVLQAAADGL